MFYRKLNINGEEYSIAVNISGSGAPTVDARAGMFYMDEDNGDVYKCLGGTEWKLLIDDEIFATIETKISRIEAKIADYPETKVLVERNEKRITNLEKGISPDPFDTDDSVAYIKDVPANALPYAEIEKVGGMSYIDESDEELVDNKVTAIEIAGANLLPFPYAQMSGTSQGKVEFSTDDAGTFTVKGTNTLSTVDTTMLVSNTAPLVLEPGTYTFAQGCAYDHTKAYMVWAIKEEGGSSVYKHGNATYTCIKPFTLWCAVQVATGATVEASFKPMICKHSTELPYSLYHKTTLSIPSEIQALDGYGIGINENCYNYIDFEKKQFVKRVGVVDMWELLWAYTEPPEGTPRYYTNTLINQIGANYEGIFPPIKQHSDPTVKANLLCVKYRNDTPNAVYVGNTAMCETNGQIWIHDSYTTADGDEEAFRTGELEGVMLYYELAEPEIIDISHLLVGDNFIEVEGCGSITMANEHNQAVPSSITYMLKGVTE